MAAKAPKLAYRLQFVDGQIRVLLPDGLPQVVGDEQRVLVGAHVKSHAEELSKLRIGAIEIGPGVVPHVRFLCIFHHADDLDVGLDIVA